MLSVKDIHVSYGSVQVLFGVSIEVSPGEILCLLGRNGAGKTTTLKTIMGLVPLTSGQVNLGSNAISNLPAHSIPRRGIAYVPQGRGLFSELSVAQNLEVGLMVNKSSKAIRENTLELFPRLKERLKQPAETLSGGEQQMLAMARAMCTEPKVLLLDEPTEGLQPSMISLIQDVIQRLKDDKVAIVLVEQHVESALSIADRITFIENGRSVDTASSIALRNDRSRIHQYLGVS